MKKTIIALAIGALSASAFAQSNVSIYGAADVSFDSVSSTGSGVAASSLGSRSRVNSNSSFIGFKGAEDLGSGLKAVFQIETTVAMDAAATFSTARDSFVGISGNFGTVAGGYMSHPYRSTVSSFDVVPAAAGVGAINGIIGNFGRAAAAGNADLFARSQAIAYVSPEFSGLTASIAYTSNETKASNAGVANPYGISLSARYENGPLKLAYARTDSHDTILGGSPLNTAAADSKLTGDFLGASWAFAQTGTTAGLVYERLRDNGSVSNEERDAWGVNLRQPVGNGEIAAAYYAAGIRSATGGDVANTKANQVVLRYGYNLSKRSQVYALYSQINNGSAAGYNFANNSVGALGGAGSLGNDPRSFGLGMRHTF